MSNNTKAYLFALAAVLCWSTVATAFKLTLEYLDVFQFVFYACLASTLVLLTPILIRGELSDLIAEFIAHKAFSLLVAGLNPVVYYLVLFAAYDRLPAQIAQPINYTWSIVLTIMTVVILKQRPTRFDIGGALVCYAGVVVIASQGDFSFSQQIDMVGLGLIVLSTLVWAYYWILNIQDRRDQRFAMCLNFMVALPATALLCWYFSSFNVPWHGLGGAVYAGVFEMGLAFILWSKALRLTNNAGRVNTLIFLSPFLSLIFINQILDQSIYTSTYLGLTVIIGGLILQKVGNGLTAR